MRQSSNPNSRAIAHPVVAVVVVVVVVVVVSVVVVAVVVVATVVVVAAVAVAVSPPTNGSAVLAQWRMVQSEPLAICVTPHGRKQARRTPQQRVQPVT